MNLRERFERLEEVLHQLRVDNANTPVLVEGVRDVRALRALGCKGRIVQVHDGSSLLDTAERLAADVPRVILLTDWDRTGGTLHRRMKENLAALGVACDEDHRRQLAQLATKETRTVEGLPAFYQNLKARVGRA